MNNKKEMRPNMQTIKTANHEIISLLRECYRIQSEYQVIPTLLKQRELN